MAFETEETTELAIVEPTLRDIDVMNPDYSFNTRVKLATHIADSLNDVIEKQKLALPIGNNGKKYVTASGWNTLGFMLGLAPVTESVEEIKVGKLSGYRARVSIKRGDQTLATAEAIAHKNNKQRDAFAVYSMSQTRAMGKAYRMCLSWIVEIAGYEATPYEEMMTIEKQAAHEAKMERARNKLKKDSKIIEMEAEE